MEVGVERDPKTRLRILLLVIALIPPAVLIVWGEFSEFNINFWLLPTTNVSQSVLDSENLLIAGYYLVTPSLLLWFFRQLGSFRESRRYLILVICCIFSFGILRYFDFIYDTNGPPAFSPFGNFYPLAFWILPLLMTALAAVLLGLGS